MDCKICSEKNVGPAHKNSEKHLRNVALQEFQSIKSDLVGNRKGIIVACNVQSSFVSFFDCSNAKIKISAKPNEMVTFQFTILNDSKKDELSVNSVQMVHSKYKFTINNNGLDGTNPQKLLPKSRLQKDITVTFRSPNVGQYETPIIFTFIKLATNEKIFIVRDMVVFVEQQQSQHEKIDSPYACKEVMAKILHRSPFLDNGSGLFLVPKNYKLIYLRSMKIDEKCDEQMKLLADDIQNVFDKGVTQENYEKFYHNLLWYEETIIRVNVKKYNMSGVHLTKQGGATYGLRVPGLAEKRPSLMLGDLLFVRPHNNEEEMFEAVITDLNESTASIGKFDHKFSKFYSAEAKYDIRFFPSRVPLERMHVAVQHVTSRNLWSRIFPTEQLKINYNAPKLAFYNSDIEENTEQRVAVEHIVAGTSGQSPYLLHGPPGTGKTVTIVESILQLVNQNPANRIMVCTDSNMAADHVATLIIKYEHLFDKGLLLRASSKFRVWETLPESLIPYSNGTSRDNFEPVSVKEFQCYNIVITTLSHAAKFARQMTQKNTARYITHLFIDEAAQSSEPGCLIPVSGLLAPNGRLVLAGDPHQLGPVVISRDAKGIGLGISLMERLIKTYPMYNHENGNPNYMVMLRNNFRSDKEILDIPDKLFYKGQLRALAAKDSLSDVDILGEKPHSHATVFHGVLSKEQKNGKSPSYFNVMECDLVKQYVQALVTKHDVSMDDIGIVTPYIRQVYVIKTMLRNIGYDKIEVGTVEAFQGKEKRVIVISTVRANCSLLDHDAKFQLGFLVDDKRFNVAITRAKAKVIIIGNPLCLYKDVKWRAYMQKCRDLGTYYGFDSEDLRSDENDNDIVANLKPMLAEMKLGDFIPKK